MKATFNESDGGFIIELEPENIKEVNQLTRFTHGSVKESIKPEVNFYRDGTVTGWIASDKNKKKATGTIK